jgi:hypothetical protein
MVRACGRRRLVFGAILEENNEEPNNQSRPELTRRRDYSDFNHLHPILIKSWMIRVCDKSAISFPGRTATEPYPSNKQEQQQNRSRN